MTEGIDTGLVRDGLEIVVFLGSLIGAFALGIWKGFRKIREQLVPNGGSSLRDAVDRIERGLYLLDARQISLFDLSLTGIFIADEKGHCVYVSPSWCELTGLMPSQAMGDGWTAGVSKEDRERMFDEWSKATKRGAIFESKYITDTGKKVATRASAIFHPQTKEIVGFIGKVWEEGGRAE